MPLADYKEAYYIQDWTKGDIQLFGVAWSLSDGERIMAGLTMARQSEIRVAEAQDLSIHYNMVTDIGVTITVNEILRRESDSMMYRVTGIPQKSPEPAASKFQVFPVVVTTRDAEVRIGPR